MRKTTSMGRYSSKWSVFSEKWKLGNEAIKYLSYQHQRAKWSKKKKGWQGQVGKTIKKAIEIHPLPNAFNKGNVYVKHHMGLMSGHPLCWGQAVSEEGCVRQVPVPLDCSSAGDRRNHGWESGRSPDFCSPTAVWSKPVAALVARQAFNQR